MRMPAVVLLVLATSAVAQEIPEAVRAKLARDGIAIGSKPMRQILEVYIDSKTPVFITSDSILKGFHVLFEESVLRLEEVRASTLADAVAFLYGGTGGLKDMEIAPQVREAAVRRLRIFLSTALLLLGREVPDAPPEAAEEAARVTKAEGMSKPRWLGPPDAGFVAIDYARFKPRGFYVGSPGLERYFRAMSWLMAIPFRIDRDEEFVAILLMHDRLGGLAEGVDDDAAEHARDALAGDRPLLGGSDDLTLRDALAMWTSNLEEMRAYYRRAQEGTGSVKDQVATRREATVRVVGAARTPDAVLFDRTATVRSPPDGLEVCAALGSAWARGRLDDKVLAVIDATKEPFAAPSLYAAYLDCVAALLDDPEPDAPALFQGPLWQAKSCQTALGGWAQLRHTWTLQAKRAVITLGRHDTEPGFVEPEPEFFARLGRLARDTRTVLKERGVFDPVHDRRAFVLRLREAREVLQQTPRDKLAGLWRERPEAATSVEAAEDLACLVGAKAFEDPAALRKVIDEWLPKLEDESEELAGPLKRAVDETRFDLDARWEDFAYLCGRLESLAHKQLRGVAFSEAERNFLKGYGEWLADVMFYAGNTYSNPKDDAMRICDVFLDPTRGKRLHVGVGRPYPIWVVYPWRGRDVICVGGVMAYHEFEHDTPLTDAEWKTLLDSPDAPAPPAWAAPLYAR
jgi:hypothetical protein